MPQKPGDGRPVDLLPGVEVATSWRARGVDMADEIEIGPDRPAEIAFHQLHMIAVVEQAQRGRADAANHLGAKAGAVALVAGMVDLAVQQLQQKARAAREAQAASAAELDRLVPALLAEAFGSG